jgi:chromosome segregation ATPase
VDEVEQIHQQVEQAVEHATQNVAERQEHEQRLETTETIANAAIDRQLQIEQRLADINQGLEGHRGEYGQWRDQTEQRIAELQSQTTSQSETLAAIRDQLSTLNRRLEQPPAEPEKVETEVESVTESDQGETTLLGQRKPPARFSRFVKSRRSSE